MLPATKVDILLSTRMLINDLFGAYILSCHLVRLLVCVVLIIGWWNCAPTCIIRAPTNEVDWFAIGDGSVYPERPYRYLFISDFVDSNGLVLIPIWLPHITFPSLYFSEKCYRAIEDLRPTGIFHCTCVMRKLSALKRCQRIQYRVAKNRCLGERCALHMSCEGVQHSLGKPHISNNVDIVERVAFNNLL